MCACCPQSPFDRLYPPSAKVGSPPSDGDREINEPIYYRRVRRGAGGEGGVAVRERIARGVGGKKIDR